MTTYQIIIFAALLLGLAAFACFIVWMYTRDTRLPPEVHRLFCDDGTPHDFERGACAKCGARWYPGDKP